MGKKVNKVNKVSKSSSKRGMEPFNGHPPDLDNQEILQSPKRIIYNEGSGESSAVESWNLKEELNAERRGKRT